MVIHGTECPYWDQVSLNNTIVLVTAIMVTAFKHALFTYACVIHGLWTLVCMGMRGYVWVCMGMHGYAWVCMGMHGYAWVCMGMYGHAWVCIGMHGHVWVCMGMHGYAWVCMGTYGYAWLPPPDDCSANAVLAYVFCFRQHRWLLCQILICKHYHWN